MTQQSPLAHAVVAVQTVLAVLRDRTARLGATARDRGASAIEFAIIAAVVVVAASVIGGVIYNIVDTKSEQLDQCANQPIGSAACTP